MPSDASSLDPQAQLRAAGLKTTLPRLAVLQALRGSDQHLTAEGLYRQLQAQGHDVGLATVYRALAQMEASGIVRRHQFASSSACFELADSAPHAHLVNLGDGAIHEFVDEVLTARLTQLALEKGLRVLDLQVTVYGEPIQPDD